MKFKSLLSALLLLFAISLEAATVDVRINLWNGTQECTDGWSGSQTITADKLSQAAVGDEIVVTVTAISQTAEWPQVSLRKSDWSEYEPDGIGVQLPKDAAIPYDARITVTADVAKEIKANGFVITGCGFTMTAIDLIHKQELAEGEKGDPVHNIWTGDKVIDWSGTIDNAWLQLSANDFSSAQSGWKLRLNYSDLAIGAQGHISTGAWTDMPDAAEYVQLSASYFEFDITDAMLAELQGNGCVVSGIGFTLTSVDLIDPTQIPSMVCTLGSNAVKCWEEGENPQISVTLQSIEAKEMNTTVSLKLRTDSYSDYYNWSEEVTVQPGETKTVTIPLTLEPGFYHAVVEANYSLLRDFNIGYDPRPLSPNLTCRPTLRSFGQRQRAT